MDSPERSRVLVDKHGLGFPILADEERRVIRAFGIEDGENGVAWPAIYVIGRDGRVVWRSLSETYKEREAPTAILAALKGL